VFFAISLDANAAPLIPPLWLGFFISRPFCWAFSFEAGDIVEREWCVFMFVLLDVDTWRYSRAIKNP